MDYGCGASLWLIIEGTDCKSALSYMRDFFTYPGDRVLDDLMSKGSNLESKSGLPLGSMADEYDIYKITANQSAPIYRSTIAPTIQRGYTTTGGATQTLVLDRSLWSAPVKYNTQSYIPDF